MKKVENISLVPGMTVDQLVKEYSRSGVLGAGGLSKGVDIFEESIKKKSTILLGIAGPMTPSGMRGIFADLIRDGYVQGVVASGANVVHDIIEAIGGVHYRGRFDTDDKKLHGKEIGRIGNVYTNTRDFVSLEDFVQGFLAGIPESTRSNLSIRELLSGIGERLDDKKSFLKAAKDMEVPVFSPGIIDSMLGLQIFFFSQKNTMNLNVVKDMKELLILVNEREYVTGIFLGGGIPKHYIMGANLLRGGLDYGIQITLDREEGGSLSGARLEEGISWGKTGKKAGVANITGDATIIFPLMVAAVRERIGNWS